MRRLVLPVVVLLGAIAALPLLLDSGRERRKDIRGEAASATAEERLLFDENVLWIGTWERPAWRRAHGAGSFESADNIRIESAPRGGSGRSLRGAARGGASEGFQYHADFVRAGLRPQTELFYRYRVFFPRDYVWQNASGGGGGKLPGLAGKAEGGAEPKVGAGGQRWNGSTEITRDELADMDGFSARMLWQKDGGLSSYLYLPDPNHLGVKSRKSWFGWSVRCKADPTDPDSSNMLFDKGAWNTVEQHVRLNTPGVANGLLEVWMNGKLCIKQDDLVYRSARHPEVKITQQYVTWFYGGPTSDYPDRDSVIYFDDAVLSKAYIGPRSSGAGQAGDG
jgi:hypothetical protein